jgi:hypothetical protein
LGYISRYSCGKIAISFVLLLYGSLGGNQNHAETELPRTSSDILVSEDVVFLYRLTKTLSARKLWLWRYRFDGIEKNMSFGEHPLVGLKDARELYFTVKKLLAVGIHPMGERKAKAEAKREETKALQREAESSFEKVALKWWECWSIDKSHRHAVTVM